MHPRYQEDNQLLDRARKGDEQAFSKLFHHYYKTLYNYIMCFVNDQIEAEDLTMVTFEKAFSNLHKYVPTFGFGTWLSRVAKNTALDFLDSRKRRPSDFIDVTDKSIVLSHSNTPEEEYIDKEIGVGLNKAISQLQDNYQDIIRWRYYDNLDYDEINSKYGVTPILARSYLCRARKQLRNMDI